MVHRAALPMQVLILLKTYYSCSHLHLLSLPAPLRIKMHLTQFHNKDFLVTHCFSDACMCSYVHVST